MSNPKAKRAPPPQLHGELAVWTLRTRDEFDAWMDGDALRLYMGPLREWVRQQPEERTPGYANRMPDYPFISFLFWSHVSGENYKLHADLER